MRRVLLGVVLSLLVFSYSYAADDLPKEVLTTYADMVYANYQDTLTLALELQTTIDEFVATPSEETLQAAREAWLAAREPYGKTEAYRFYGGPIDNAEGPEGLINAWPLDEVYIDYVEGAPETGIINDLTNYPEITPELLEELNEQGAEENISVGYHAIEFLLWGQDLSEDGAGNRPYTDYTTAPNATRRAAYLQITADLLVQHLETLVAAWSPETESNYRTEFLAQDPELALTAILTGAGVLSKSELAGERIYTAYDNQDQEDEHSCFSDNTHRDIANNFASIRNVLTGQYERLDGTLIEGASILDLVREVDAARADELLALIETAQTAIDAIPAPFDQAIIDPDQREIVYTAVLALFDLGDAVAETATVLGLTVNTALPE